MSALDCLHEHQGDGSFWSFTINRVLYCCCETDNESSHPPERVTGEHMALGCRAAAFLQVACRESGKAVHFCSPGPLQKKAGLVRGRKQDGTGHETFLHTNTLLPPFFILNIQLSLMQFDLCLYSFLFLSFCAGLTLFSYHLEAVQPFLCSVKLQLINSGGSQLTEHRTKLVLLFSSYLRRLGMAAQGSTVGSSKDYTKCTMSWADRS